MTMTEVEGYVVLAISATALIALFWTLWVYFQSCRDSDRHDLPQGAPTMPFYLVKVVYPAYLQETINDTIKGEYSVMTVQGLPTGQVLVVFEWTYKPDL